MADFMPLMGYTPDRAGTDRFLSSLPRPLLAQAGPDLLLDTAKEVFLGDYLLRCDPHWKRGSQKIGSCTGWAYAMSCDLLAACDIFLRGDQEIYGGRVLEASIYGPSRVEVRGGDRNLNGDGSFGGACAEAVTTIGTLHYGIDYGNGYRFVQNSGSLEKDWGRDGMPDELEPSAARHKVSAVALVESFEEAAKAIQNGFPVAVCSSRGFSMTLRDGYLTPMGTWMHAMCFCGIRWKPRPALLCANSWGDCYDGSVDPNLPPQFQKSSGWVDADTCDGMLSGEDSFALSGYSGFEPRVLDNWTGGVL